MSRQLWTHNILGASISYTRVWLTISWSYWQSSRCGSETVWAVMACSVTERQHWKIRGVKTLAWCIWDWEKKNMWAYTSTELSQFSTWKELEWQLDTYRMCSLQIKWALNGVRTVIETHGKNLHTCKQGSEAHSCWRLEPDRQVSTHASNPTVLNSVLPYPCPFFWYVCSCYTSLEVWQLSCRFRSNHSIVRPAS